MSLAYAAGLVQHKAATESAYWLIHASSPPCYLGPYSLYLPRREPRALICVSATRCPGCLRGIYATDAGTSQHTPCRALRGIQHIKNTEMYVTPCLGRWTGLSPTRTDVLSAAGNHSFGQSAVDVVQEIVLSDQHFKFYRHLTTSA
jgi:hypothetical protein